MTLQPLETLLLATLALLLGRLVNRLVPLLSRYNIPDPITGGLLVSIGLALAGALGDLHLEFDNTAKPVLLLAFFSAVGLSADLAMLRHGGKRLLLFVIVLAPFLVLQNLLGILIAKGMDMHPLMGLVGGTITLVGGHGTGAAYADRFAEVHNLQSIMELSMTSATLGLVAGGIIGGPVAQWLIRRHRLEAGVQRGTAQSEGGATQAEPVGSANFLTVLSATLAALVIGQVLAGLFSDSPITLPSFLWCLLMGVAIRNLLPLARVRLNDGAIDLLASVTLSLFLVITMMALNLAHVATVAGPLLLILVAQSILAMVYAAMVVFRFTGRDYESVVLSAAFCGFSTGATATAIANMQAIARKYGPAPEAFIVAPLVGAFLIDLLNALVLTGFLSLPGMGG
ncbi:sodium/glutamate symporter [Metapseudomonas furukawaii]|uniref:Sodium/glutamate symporter n=1 Tax=Metapseudomonas furukawaii TaxID=1149133 RepID=A0AAD1C2L2_METFU|nr:sodium/glutamate symporter [Pseudomonas furukawaii]ELS30093.1 Sodium/glutamate symport protein [Pseudomonas furukawaii]BAU75602.1 sodium/glutamate symport protein [Pseudomonas furukawaii]